MRAAATSVRCSGAGRSVRHAAAWAVPGSSMAARISRPARSILAASVAIGPAYCEHRGSVMDGRVEAVHPGDMNVCVIGAGAAGLGAMEVLQGHGIAFDCFEQSERVGGHWHTDYESLHLITSRDISGFAGCPMPSSFPVYPSRDQMRSYLESFASETGVRAHVRFGVRVDSVTPL